MAKSRKGKVLTIVCLMLLSFPLVHVATGLVTYLTICAPYIPLNQIVPQCKHSNSQILLVLFRNAYSKDSLPAAQGGIVILYIVAILSPIKIYQSGRAWDMLEYFVALIWVSVSLGAVIFVLFGSLGVVYEQGVIIENAIQRNRNIMMDKEFRRIFRSTPTLKVELFGRAAATSFTPVNMQWFAWDQIISFSLRRFYKVSATFP